MIIPAVALWGQNSRSSLEERRKKTLEEITATEKILKQNQASQSKSLQQLNLLSKQITQRNKLLSEVKEEISLVDKNISTTQSGIRGLEHQLEEIKNEYAAVLRDYQKKKHSKQVWLYIFGSEDITQAYRRHKYFQQYMDFRRAQYDSALVLRTRHTQALALLNNQRKEKNNLLSVHQAESTKLNNSQKEYDKELKTLRANASKLNKELASKRAIASQLNKEIQTLITSTAKAKGASSSKKIYNALTPAERIISDKFSENKGRLPWPSATGEIVGQYGKHPHPFLKGVTLPDNYGIDIATDNGSVVRAVFDGEVSKIVAIKGANYTIIIRHGKYLTVYQNLINIKVKQGEKVSRNQTLGTVFTDPSDSSSVYHFEIWEEMNKQNPVSWIVKR